MVFPGRGEIGKRSERDEKGVQRERQEQMGYRYQ